VYSIGRRLSLLLAVQTIIGHGPAAGPGIYGATHMLFVSKQDEELRSYTAVLADVLQDAYTQGGEAEMMPSWPGCPRRPGTFVQVMPADASEIYRDAHPPSTWDMPLPGK
jgi:two-component system, OmpR family, heavy metal sensor histidine kinase CusS